jgi:hypothetical protein
MLFTIGLNSFPIVAFPSGFTISTSDFNTLHFWTIITGFPPYESMTCYLSVGIALPFLMHGNVGKSEGRVR